MSQDTTKTPTQDGPGRLPEPPSRDSLPPELRAPLARFAGERPPAPAWFDAALAVEPDRMVVATPRGKLEVLTWGEVGKPGLLLVHGNFASVDWWNFVAPFFAADHRVAALSLAGMGASDWRETYDFASFADDAQAVAEAAGLYANGAAPAYVGQSFGGGLVLWVAAHRPEQLSCAILVDANFRSPPPQALEARMNQPAPKGYPSLEAALARFRLLPAQPVENLFILDHIARTSFRATPAADGTGEVWTFKYDPAIAAKIDYAERAAFFASKPPIAAPIAHLYGEQSQISVHGAEARLGPYPADGLEIGMAEANHHVIIDQPLAMVTAIRSLLAAWRA
jgi:pimeloyl-ACP methyl ester carboxylesterase